MNKLEAIQIIRYLSGALIRVKTTEVTCEEFLKCDLDMFMDILDKAYENSKKEAIRRMENTDEGDKS